MWGVDYKKRMEDILFDDLKGYLKDEGLEGVFDMPIMGYADANDPGFTYAFENDLTSHPKGIYRPGHTIIVSFLPFKWEYVKSNFNGAKEVSKEWIHAYEKSIMVSSHINGVIMKALEDMGREASLTALPGDWDEESGRPEWSHKIAAYIAGMGQFGPAGSLDTAAGPLGRFNSVITEVPMEYTGSSKDGVSIADAIRKGSLNTKAAKDKCPANAISEDSIDMTKCMEFCGSLEQAIPEPDVCGKCFD